MAYKITKILCILMAVAAFSASIIPAITLAAGEGNSGQTYTLLEPLPCIPSENKPCPQPATSDSISSITSVDMSDFFQYAFNFMIALAAVAAVFMIVWGGFQYVTTDSWQGKSEGLSKFKNALIGLAMVLLTFLILKTVNPKLVQFPASIPPVIKSGDARLQSTSDWYDKVQSEYAIQDQKLLADFKQTNQNIQTIQAQTDDLKLKLNQTDPNDQEERTRIQSQIAANEDQIRKSKGTIENSAAKLATTNIITTTATSMTTALDDAGFFNKISVEDIQKIVQDGKEKLTNVKNNIGRSLDEIGAYEQKADLNNQVYDADVMLDIIGEQAKIDAAKKQYWYKPINFTKGQERKTINELAAKIGNIQDPTIKKDAQTRLDASRTKLEALSLNE